MLAISAEGENKNKKAMGWFENEVLALEIALVQFVQDAVNIETSLKYSWANWFLIVDGQRP